MVLKGRICLNKKKLPSYIFKFNVALIVYFVVMTAVLLAAGIAIGIALGDDPTAVFTLVFLIVYLTSPCGIGVFLQVHSADEDTVQFEEEYPLDGALFNFIDKRGFIKDYENNREFALLKQDKKNFCRLSLGFKLK